MRWRPDRWLDDILIALLFIVILGFYSASLIDPVLLPKFVGWGGVLILTGLILLGQRSIPWGQPFRRNPIPWALGSYILISGLTLLKSRNLADGAFEWFKGFFLLVFVLLLIWRFAGRKSVLINGFVIGTIALAYAAGTFGLYQFVTVSDASGFSHQTSYAISGTFSHRNLYAEVLFLTLPFSVYGFQQFSRAWRWLSLGAAFLALFIIVILMSRAVWLAVVAAVVAPLLLALGLAIRRRQLSTGLRQNAGAIMKVAGAFVFIIVLSILTYIFLDATTALKKQMVSIVQFNFTYGSIEERIDLWSKSWDIIKAQPFTGVGPGDWEQALLAQGNKGMLSANNETFFQRPHNDFLWVASESGLPGMLAYLGIFGGAIFMLVKPLWAAPANKAYQFNYPLLAALAGYLTYALFSFPKERIEHQVLLGFILAITGLQAAPGVSGTGNGNRSSVMGKTGLCLVIALIGFGVYMGYERLQAEAATKDALKARLDQQPEQVIAHINRAERPFYQIDPMSTPLPWYSGSAHYKLGNHQKALEHFRKAYRLNPYHMHVVNNLATLYQVTGQPDSAIHYFKRALSLSPKFTSAALNLAAIYYNQKKYEKAIQAIRRLSYQADHAKYKKYLMAILEARGKMIRKKLDNRKLASTIQRITGTRHWLLNVFEKSLDKRSFRYQLIEDAIYALHKQEKAISSSQAIQLRKKYLSYE
jgi:O-antigen ligase/lipoprotein NlpI